MNVAVGIVGDFGTGDRVDDEEEGGGDIGLPSELLWCNLDPCWWTTDILLTFESCTVGK